MKHWLSCDFHNHTSLDMEEIREHHPVQYSPEQLIDRAAKLGYDAISLTHHDALQYPHEVVAYAKKRGIVLIPGVEKTIQGKHVLILNVTDTALLSQLKTLPDLAQLPQSALIIAPHPYYILGSCLMGDLEKHIDLFDAIEWNAWYSFFFNFPNRKAKHIALKYNKPLVGNTDTHELYQFGTTKTLVFAEKTTESIISAVKAGKIKLASKPMNLFNFFRVVIFRILLGFVLKLLYKKR